MNRQQVTEITIGILALVSIVLVAIEALANLSRTALIWLYIADLVICIAFAIDFVIRLIASDDKPKFLKNNGYEILTMVPAISLYVLGTIPALAVVLRSFRLIRVVMVILLFMRTRRLLSTSNGFLQKSNLLTLGIITVFIIFLGAFAAFILDSGTEGGRINNFSDAVWWSISTVTTVGYGDIVPSSISARIMGMCLMVIGIGVMAAFISQVSATLVESRIKRKQEKGDFKTAVITEIKNKLDILDQLSDKDVYLLIQTIQSLRSREKDNN